MKKTLILALVFAAALASAQKLTPALDSIYRFYVTQDYESAEDALKRLDASARRPNDRFLVKLEIGDFYLDKLQDYALAESTYREILKEIPETESRGLGKLLSIFRTDSYKQRRRPDIIYRLALTQELQEKFLDAAKNYEKVACRYMKSTYGEDALDAIERCFRKNYQDRVAYVNKFPLTRIELDDRISRYPIAYEVFEKKQQLLDTMIENRLLYEAALSANVLEDPAYATGLKETRDRAVFEEWYNREVNAKAEPSEKALQARYRKDRPTRYTTPEKVHAYQIVVPTRAKADSLRRVLLTDTTAVWDSIAKTHSTAPDKDRAGDMGFFARGVHPKQIEGMAFRLKPGQMSPPVKTEDGFVILKATEKKPKVVRPYKEVRNQIQTQVRQENINRIYEQKVEELKRKTTIELDSTAIEENRDTLVVVDGIVIDRTTLEQRLNTIPPFYRSQFQTPEGKQRILDQLILEKLILKDCEAKKTWLWNRVVDQVLARRSRMLIDRYKAIMTTEKVEIDSAELKTDYQETIDEFKVLAQVHAREIVASTWSRASQLRRWAVAGRLPQMIEGRGLLIPDSDETVEMSEILAATENTDSLLGLSSLTGPPALLPHPPVTRSGNYDVPDMSSRCELAGPFRSESNCGFAFADLSKEDKLYKPELETAQTAEELAELLNLELETDSTGVPVLDSSRLGSYVILDQALPTSFVKGLFKLKVNEVAEPRQIPDGVLLVKVTKKDTAREITFADLAQRFSTASSKWSGGDIHWLTRDDKARDKKVISAAFSLSKNRISRVIKLNDSTYAFIKVEEKKKAFTRPFEEVSAKIDGKIRQAKLKELYDALIQDLSGKAEIEILMKESDFIFETEELEEQPPEEEIAPEEQE